MDPIEGLYLVALASVFALIPSGPAYAGTQDAAVIDRHQGARRHRRDRAGLPADAALRDRRADHASLGLILLVARYGGLSKLRAARAEARS